MGSKKSFRIFADYHQFFLCDATCENNLADAWSCQAIADRLAVGDGIIGVHTARNMDVRVEVEVLERAPKGEIDLAQHVTECSLPAPTGTLLLMDPSGTVKQARRIKVPKGVVRVRVSHQGLDTISDDGLRGKDSYHVAIWPGTAIESRVIRRWVEPEKPAPPEIKAPKTQKQAVTAALQGHTDIALAKLIELSQKKRSALAAASAAELLAFRGDWRGVIEHAGVFLEDLSVIGASNVFDEMLDLLHRAGRETGSWDAVAAAVKRVPKSAAASIRETARRFLGVIKDGRGRDPSGSTGWPALSAAEPPARDLARYEKARQEAASSKRFAGHPAELHRHLFALALVNGVEDDMLATYETHPSDMEFEAAVSVARILVKRGRPEDAWRAIKDKSGDWYAPFVCSVAPVGLLVDPILASIMTPDRCAQLLATPRCH